MNRVQHFTRIYNEVDGVIETTPYTRDLNCKEGRVLLSLLAKTWDLFKVNPEKAFAEFKLEFNMIRKYHNELSKISN